MAVDAGEFQLIYDPSVGENEPWYINDHTVFRDRDGTWHLIGITHPEPMDPLQERDLAHATAPSLQGPWTKQPYAMSADATWGETQLWAPHVIDHDGRYWMFVCAGGQSENVYRLHLATSDDAFTWTRHADNPLVVDGFHARDPMVLRVGDRWVMYYTATSTPTGGHHVVKAVESDDLAGWSNERIVYTDPLEGTWGGPTESPFVYPRDGLYYLFIGPDLPAYRRTRVLASDDPLRFSLDDQVGKVNAHAAEVVVDENGAEWVTHCGWGQGGVWLAPLRFS